MKTEKHLFFIEVTDTYSGEANYCWADRYIVRASSARGAIGVVARESGLSFRSNGFRYDAQGACICAFVDYFDPGYHGQYLRYRRDDRRDES